MFILFVLGRGSGIDRGVGFWNRSMARNQVTIYFKYIEGSFHMSITKISHKIHHKVFIFYFFFYCLKYFINVLDKIVIVSSFHGLVCIYQFVHKNQKYLYLFAFIATYLAKHFPRWLVSTIWRAELTILTLFKPYLAEVQQCGVVSLKFLLLVSFN